MSRRYLIISGIIAAVIAALLIYPAIHPRLPEEHGISLKVEGTEINASAIPDLSLEGYVEVKPSIYPPFLILEGGCYRLSMIVSTSQQDSIQSGLEGTVDYRPNAHDLAKDIFDILGINLMAVKIESFKDETYYARIFISQGKKVINLDSRPSDAIALAVRMNAPVYVKKDLMERFGERIC